MKTIEVRLPYDMPREAMRARLDEALVKAREEYASTVGPIEAAWEGERLKVHFSVMGMAFDGGIEVAEKELLVSVNVPGLAGMFAGKIREGIEERLGGLIATAEGRA